MSKKALLFVLALVLYGLSNAQPITVKGKVSDATTGEPIPFASVLVQGTLNGVSTDVDGYYSISAGADAVLVFSSIGYLDSSVAIEGRNVINVDLAPDTELLDEVVVVAMGMSRQKKSLGYATQDVKSDQLMQAASSDLAGALSGKLSGVNITPSSGMPGASSKITIRGSRSFDGDNTPLYVIDGMPVTSAAIYDTDQSVTGSDYSNRSIDIDPNDIESINILKGQAASALYGMRASNGVVMITTKSGKGASKDKASVTFSSSVVLSTVSTLPDYQMEYAQGSKGKFNHNTSLVWGPKISDLPDDPKYGGNTANDYTANGASLHQGMYYVPQLYQAGLDPWVYPAAYNNMKEFYKTGVEWTNFVNLGKAFDGGNFSISLGNSKQTGIIENTGMERYNARVGGQSKLSKLFDAGFSASFVSTVINKQTGGNDGLTNGVYAAPASYDLAGIPCHKPGDPYSQIHFRGLTFNNPYWAVKNNNFQEKTQRFFGNVWLNFNYKFNQDMKIDAKYQLGDDAYTNNNRNIFGYGHRGDIGEVEAFGTTINEMNSLFTVSFDWNINKDLHLNAFVGNEMINKHTSEYDMFGNGFNFPGWNDINNAVTVTSREYLYDKRTFGTFANLALDWKSMLFLNASYRYDLVSTMPRGNRGFYYPSVSLGFIFTEIEPVQNDVLTFGKLRASYAEVGMAGTYKEDYYSIPAYGGGFSSGTPFAYPVGNITAYTPYSVVYDPALSPQNTRSYEGGVDLGFWNGLLSLSYTYSRQNVTDQIFKVPMAGSTGSSDLVTNAGSVHTNAHEFTLTAYPIRRKNVKWDMSLNFTKIDNYVDDLAEGVESIYLGGFVEPQVRAGIGEKFPVIYGVSYLRNENGDIVVDKNGYPQAGEEKVIGSVAPDFQVGFNTSLEIYKVRLAATLDWKQGGSMYCGTSAMMDYYGTSQKSADYRNMESFLFELPAVKEIKDATGNVTGYEKNDIMLNDAAEYFSRLNDISEYFVKGTSYVKLRELSISYPFSLGKNVTLTANAFARNIILWSELKGFDPEASQGNNNMGGGFERFSLPGASSYGFGVTLKF